MESQSSLKLRRVEAPRLLKAEQYRVLVPGSASLFGALVTALLENLSPGTAVTVVEYAPGVRRANDVLIEQMGTGRKLVVFGSSPTRSVVADHFNDGVVSLVGIDSSRSELLAAIQSLDDGPAFVSSTIVRALANEIGTPEPTDKLTARERDVLKLLVDGHSNREIAGRLFVSPNTVRSHLQSISTKLGISSRAKLAAYGRSVPIRD